MSLFIFSSVFNDGFNGPKETFRAFDAVHVAAYILKEIELYSEKGKRYFSILSDIDYHHVIDSTDNYKRNSKLFKKYLWSISPIELLELIYGSSVNGGSNAHVSILKLDTIVDLTII